MTQHSATCGTVQHGYLEHYKFPSTTYSRRPLVGRACHIKGTLVSCASRVVSSAFLGQGYPCVLCFPRVSAAWPAAFWARRASGRSRPWSRIPLCPLGFGGSVRFDVRLVSAPRRRRRGEGYTLRCPLSAAAPLVNRRRVDSRSPPRSRVLLCPVLAQPCKFIHRRIRAEVAGRAEGTLASCTLVSLSRAPGSCSGGAVLAESCGSSRFPRAANFGIVANFARVRGPAELSNGLRPIPPPCLGLLGRLGAS